MYISPSGVRVLELENRNGNPSITKRFTVSGVEDYFQEVLAMPGSYEVANLSHLVDAIVTECKNVRCATRKVMIASDCLTIETNVLSEKGKGSIKGALTGDITELFGKEKNNKKGKKELLPPDKMECKISWGDLVEDGTLYKKVTSSVGDKFTLQSVVREFYRRGYEVIYISDTMTSLLNLRNTKESSFDSEGKVYINFDSTIRIFATKQDKPISITNYNPMLNEDIYERIDGMVRECAERIGKFPTIYLAGADLCDTDKYQIIKDRLETSGYTCYEVFQPNPTTHMWDESVVSPDYTVNVALCLSAYAKEVVSLLPQLEFSELFRKNSKAIASLFLGVSILALCASGFLAVTRFLDVREAETHPPRVNDLQMQIQTLQSNQMSLQSTIDTLTQADVTVLDLMTFIVSNESPMVTLVSLDTMDMLPASYTVEYDGIAVEDETVDGYSGGPGSVREAIILRGYARTGPDAVAYYDRLFNSNLSSDPILNGIEKVELPNGEIAYIFEIQIGGGV